MITLYSYKMRQKEKRKEVIIDFLVKIGLSVLLVAVLIIMNFAFSTFQ